MWGKKLINKPKMQTADPPVFDPVPAREVQHRVQTLKTSLSAAGLDAVLLMHKPDLYYFSGTAQDAYLYVAQDMAPLLLVRRYLPRARAESGIPDIVPIRSVSEIPGRIRDFHGRMARTMGIAFDVVPVRDYRFYQKLFPTVAFQDASPHIAGCRQIKSDWEIVRMEAVAELSRDIFDFIAANMVPGESEIAFCGRIEAFARTRGHAGLLQMRHYRAEGYPFHLLSGTAGGVPGALDSPLCGTGTCNAFPYGAGPRRIRENEPIFMDLGTMMDGYHMDETRMLVMGRMEDEAGDACLAAIDILEHIREIMMPGICLGEIFKASTGLAERMGLASTFLGLPDLKSRFIGHGIGLELVESPVIAAGKPGRLAPGMVLAVEPKFIFKDRFAAGIESVIHITETGSRFLSRTENRVFDL